MPCCLKSSFSRWRKSFFVNQRWNRLAPSFVMVSSKMLSLNFVPYWSVTTGIESHGSRWMMNITLLSHAFMLSLKSQLAVLCVTVSCSAIGSRSSVSLLLLPLHAAIATAMSAIIRICLFLISLPLVCFDCLSTHKVRKKNNPHQHIHPHKSPLPACFSLPQNQQ